MSSSRPRLTVACVVERDGKFLMVKEHSGGQLVINQPAGHVEFHETIPEAARRETLEETCWRVQLEYFLGVSRYHSPHNNCVYMRHTFVAKPLKHETSLHRDTDIEDTLWLSFQELQREREHLRSPLVLDDVERYLAGIQYPLAIFDDTLS